MRSGDLLQIYKIFLPERIVVYMKYDVVIIGAGPGGIFSAYELMKQNNDLKIAVFEAGNPLSKRHSQLTAIK